MALDTGATYTMIPWKVVESLGYEPALSEKRTSVVTTSTIEVVPLITMECIKVLGVKADNVDVACHDLPPKSRTEGLLGLSFLNRFNIDLHFKKRTLEIKDP
jgi:predicted aspartyl protease